MKQSPQDDKKCKALTKSGERCNLKPGPSGYCYIHNPERVAAEKAAQEEAIQKVKAEKEAEAAIRSQQLKLINETISTLEERSQQYQEFVRQHKLLKSVVQGLYIEIDKLTKKAPSELITELALEQINEVIKDTKNLLKEDPYIQKLDIFVAAGDMPPHRDALLVLGQIKQGLDRAAGIWDTTSITEKLEQARFIKLAVEYALAGEKGSAIMGKIKQSGRWLSKFPEDWVIKESHDRESSFNFYRLDSIHIQDYFGV